MREIKFRVWDKSDKKMVFDVGVHPHITEAHDDGTFTVRQAIDRWELMQYTGLKDKSGVEIYEGDIVRKDGEYNGIIDWHYNSWVARLWYEESYEWQPLTDRWTEYGEVIGNIYENPELLR